MGAVLRVVAAGVVMPLWRWQVAPNPPPVPNFDPVNGVAPAVYGVVLGGTYGSLRS